MAGFRFRGSVRCLEPPRSAIRQEQRANQDARRPLLRWLETASDRFALTLAVRCSLESVYSRSKLLVIIAIAARADVAVADDAASQPKPVVREERAVQIDGASETWRLEWVKPPEPVCAPEDPVWFTCPCQGFEFGEEGELDLVRLRSSKEVDRLHLTPFFRGKDTPSPAWEKNHAALRRWPVLDSDQDWFTEVDTTSDDAGLAAFQKAVSERTPVTVLDLQDFNHDGWAAEFVLQIGTLPCGKRESVLVGISRDWPKLHVFRSVERPDKPLVLFFQHWERMRVSGGKVRTVTWPCGDHASEVHDETVLRVDAKGFHAMRETFSCDVSEGPPGAVHGKLLSREIL